MKSIMIESEKKIERALVNAVKEYGGMCIKLLCNNLSGLPDRLVLMPHHKIVFVELKTTGQKPRRIQTYIHNKLKNLGFRVEIIDKTADIIPFIKSVIYEN